MKSLSTCHCLISPSAVKLHGYKYSRTFKAISVRSFQFEKNSTFVIVFSKKEKPQSEESEKLVTIDLVNENRS